MELNKENAKSFNSSLKKAISQLVNQKVTVRIINSYKFPNCWVEVYAETSFENEFRLLAFDSFGNKRENLINNTDVCYGNITSGSVAGKVFEWENLIKQVNENK